MKIKIEKSFVMQQDQADCGVACLLSIIRYYHGNETLEKLREISGTTKKGTTLLGLYQGANQIGFNAKGCQSDIDSLIEHNQPAILHILKNGQLEHYIVFYSYFDNKFLIGDPSEGIKQYTQSQLEEIWVTHRCLVLEPNKFFQTIRKINRDKLKWLFLLLKEDVNILISSVILGLSLSALGMATAIFSQKLIDTLIPTKDANKLLVAIIFLFFLLIIRSILQYLRGKLIIRQNMNFNNRIVSYFYDSLLFLPKRFFDSREVGDIVARLNDTSRIQRTIALVVGSLFIDLLTVVVAYIVILYYSLDIALVTILFMPFFFIIIFSQNKRILEQQKHVMVGYAWTESNFIDTIKGVTEVKVSNQQQSFGKKGSSIYAEYQHQIFYLGSIQLSLNLVYSIVGILFTCSMLAIGGHLVIEGNLKLGAFIATFSLVSTLIPSVINLAMMPIPLSEARIAFDRMYEFSSVEPEINIAGTNISEIASLNLINISFRFPGRKPLFKNISFCVNVGEVIAIVGESGCGKSTIAQIIERFYLPEEGSILINGNIPLDNINPNYWRNFVGYVPQFPHIFNGTVSENILFETETISYQKLVDFLGLSGLDKYFNDLPQGLQTLVGEKGINLSGGQIQLLSLVRVLIKAPKILILDEITSAMDRETEHFVLGLFRSLRLNVAIVFITHRLHILKTFADRIYVIENNTIINYGNHQDLMKSKNFYSRFWSELEIQHI